VPKGLVPVLVLLAACSYTPAGRERAHVYDTLRAMPGVLEVTVGCQGALLANDSLCADVVTKVDESPRSFRFERVGFGSFGPNATNVVVSEASGLVPRIASCTNVGPPNFHREAALGEHFQPTLIDLKEAIARAREILEEVQYWPRCPMSWDVQDKRGVNYRYCARKKDETAEPPRPTACGRE
jgi:hypothetical protein